MTRGRLSRRGLLQGLGAAGIALPMLHSVRGSAQTKIPPRLLLVFTANGTIRGSWTPRGTETNFTFPTILKPLDKHKKKMIVLDGLDMNSAYSGPGDGHMKGMGHLWTATELLSGTLFKCGGKTPCSGWGGGISVDQYIASKLQPKTKFRTLELGVQVKSATVWSRMCYAGRNRPIPPQEDPYTAFDRIFAGVGQDKSKLDALRLQRKSVLDAVRGDLTALEKAADTADRALLQAHLAGVRAIERQLDSGGLIGANCKVPTLGTRFDYKANSNYPRTGKLMMDLVSMALACNQTRIASLQWSRSVSNTVMNWIGVNQGHHTISHKGDSDKTAVSDLIKINTWYSQQFAYLLDKLDGIQEGAGTMLDNTIVLWGNELGKGNAHSRREVPFVMAGNAGNYFKTGRFLKYNKESHSDLLVSVCNAMGVQTKSFGNPKFCTGPLTRLKG